MNLVGRSAPFLATLNLIRKIAQTDASVLIQGETGTGKEAVARAVHYLGARRPYPFVPVNCGALPDNLIENELFGHIKGAFTDARETRTGVIGHAEGGTLFLDEIESLPPKGQAVLLRFLQDGLYRPLGGREQRKANVRIVAATNRDLREMVRSGEFRRDLFYRLAVMPIAIPPLRERGTDVVLLAQHFVEHFARQYGIPTKRLDHAAAVSLLAYDWPGNVRELENLVHREFLLAEGHELQLPITEKSAAESSASAAILEESCPFHLGFQGAKAFVIAEFERLFITRMLVDARGNISLAARRAGKERRAFAKLLKKYGIDRRLFAGESGASPAPLSSVGV